MVLRVDSFHMPIPPITYTHSQQMLKKIIKAFDFGEIAGGIATVGALFTSIVCGLLAMILNPPIGIGCAIVAIAALGCASLCGLVVVICGLSETLLRSRLNH